jgi:hypothetical protein
MLCYREMPEGLLQKWPALFFAAVFFKITLVLYSRLYGNMLRDSFNAYRHSRSVSSLAAVSIGPVIGPAAQAVCNIRPLYCLQSNKVRQWGTRKWTRSIFINVSSGVFTLIDVIRFLFKAFMPRISVRYGLLGRRIVVLLVAVAADKFLPSTASTLWALRSLVSRLSQLNWPAGDISTLSL